MTISKTQKEVKNEQIIDDGILGWQISENTIESGLSDLHLGGSVYDAKRMILIENSWKLNHGRNV